MPEDRLSAKEAALLAQVRAELGKTTADAAASAPVARAQRSAAAAAIESVAPGAVDHLAPGAVDHLAPGAVERVVPGAINPIAPGANVSAAPAGAAPGTSLDPAGRIAALMTAARAEAERRRRRQRQLYVWIPVAFISVVGLWTLLWMWYKL